MCSSALLTPAAIVQQSLAVASLPQMLLFGNLKAAALLSNDTYLGPVTEPDAVRR